MRIAVRLSCVLALAVVACTSHEGAPESTPEPRKTETPVKETPVKETPVAPQIALRGAIASVSLIQNCSDDEPHLPPPPAAGQPAAAKDEARIPAAAEPMPGSRVAQLVAPGASAKPGGGGFRQPCTQSFMQLNLAHDAKQAQKIEIEAVRLTAAGTGTKLGHVPFRGPTHWDEGGRYVVWDQTIPAAQEIKASYKLGEIDWTEVGKAVGNDDTYSPRYVLEVDVAIAGRTITLRSNEFQREHAHVIVT